MKFKANFVEKPANFQMDDCQIKKVVELYDLELKQAQGCYFFTPATRQTQKDTIRELRRFVVALEATGDDRRRQVNVVRELLKDMSLHPHWWNGKDNGFDRARDKVDRVLVRMTAQMLIRFTHILLGDPYQMTIAAAPAQTQEESATPQMGLTM